MYRLNYYPSFGTEELANLHMFYIFRCFHFLQKCRLGGKFGEGSDYSLI